MANVRACVCVWLRDALRCAHHKCPSSFRIVVTRGGTFALAPTFFSLPMSAKEVLAFGFVRGGFVVFVPRLACLFLLHLCFLFFLFMWLWLSREAEQLRTPCLDQLSMARNSFLLLLL
jgi:hypothetical protein